MDGIANRWDGIELWITGLPFIPQALVVLVVLVPAAFGLAVVFDRVLAAVLRLLGRDRRRPEAAEQATVAGSDVKEGT